MENLSGGAEVSRSAAILENFRTRYDKSSDLTLRPGYRALLAEFGDPQNRIPPVFHVAGTNGKGSTCAFLRAMLEAAGYRVHVYTSPHLVRFHERIRIAGKLIADNELTEILSDCERLAAPGKVSYFEAATAAAFVAFARHAADFTILETGLGGRRDATNIIEKPLATLITRLSYDHRSELGDGIDAIAREKAGIMRPHIPCFAAPQSHALALVTLRAAAEKIGAPLFAGGAEWQVEEQIDGLRFTDQTRRYDLPRPALLGRHQYENAGLAIAALSALPQPIARQPIAAGLTEVEWPARLQRLSGFFALPETEIWIDGGHNDSAGEALAVQIARWRAEDGTKPRPLHVLLGMLTTKHPDEFVSPFKQNIARLRTVSITGEPLSFSAASLAEEIKKLGVVNVASAASVQIALSDLAPPGDAGMQPRLLICGSLYLAGMILGLEAEFMNRPS